MKHVIDQKEVCYWNPPMKGNSWHYQPGYYMPIKLKGELKFQVS